MARLFTKQEIRGIALLLPIVVVAVWLLIGALTTKELSTPKEEPNVTESPTPILAPFDPNTITYEELRAMGIEKYVARGIVKYREGGRTYAIPEDVAIVYGISDSLYALLKPYIRIGEGCDNCCAYCAIPGIRGKFRSRPMEDLVEEAKQLEALGVRELTVVAQDITRYGLDLYGKYSLAELLHRITEETSIPWIRLLYCYPDKITDELIAEIRKAGARITLHTDGDVAGSLMVVDPSVDVDVMMGTGGTPEGVISACAIKGLGGQIFGRFDPQSQAERDAMIREGINLDEILHVDSIINAIKSIPGVKQVVKS